MDISLLLRGVVIGFSIAAPVGPIGVLCIRRTLAEGRICGLASGLGAATADAVYGLIAGLGLTMVSHLLLDWQMWLRLGGGAFLCYLGVRSWFSPPAIRAAAANGRGVWGAYATTFALTLTNPMTILSFAAIFGGLGLAGARGDYGAALSLVAGVFGGSACWWLLLSGGTSILRARLDAAWLRGVNRLAGLVMIVFGLRLLWEVLRG